MSKFAEEQLKKYGWSKGEGIGKTSQGIVDPIKASFKYDNSGVGFDIAEEFTANWWEHLFNHTAKNIDPTKELKKEEVTVKHEGVLNRKSLFYARFQKASVLVDGREKVVEKVVIPVKKEETYDKKGKKIVSDEELFKLCEGRTAHKGARHGIKMNGKLARLEEQEAALMQIYQKKSKEMDFKPVKRALQEEKTKETLNVALIEEEAIIEVVTKKKKKSKKNKDDI